VGAVRLLVADVGNTAVKVVAFDAAGAVLRASVHRRRDELVAAGRALARARVPVVVVSVSSRRLAALEACARRRLAVLGRDLPLRVANRTLLPAQTGGDRLCAAAAAHARAGGAAVALGVGTAVTVDLVDASGAFLGGAIAPGPSVAEAGLAAAAPRLAAGTESDTFLFSSGSSGRRSRAENKKVSDSVRLPARTTGAALRAGTLLGFAGLLDRLAEEAVAALGGGVPVYLHGGGAPPFGPLLRAQVVAAPHLVAEGARVLWLRAGA